MTLLMFIAIPILIWGIWCWFYVYVLDGPVTPKHRSGQKRASRGLDYSTPYYQPPTPPPPINHISDKYGNPLGFIDSSSGVDYLHDKYGNPLGYYDSSVNQTCDKYGNTITQGNSLTGLFGKK